MGTGTLTLIAMVTQQHPSISAWRDGGCKTSQGGGVWTGSAAWRGVPGLGARRGVHQDLGGQERPTADPEDQVHVSSLAINTHERASCP